MASAQCPEMTANSSQWQEMYHTEDTLWWYRGLRLFLSRILRESESQGRDVLDIGCGTARFLQDFEDSAEQTIGIDISLTALQLAKKRRKQTQLIQADGLQLPFASSSFDLVCSIDVLETKWVKPETLFSEAQRVLKPKGTFLVQAAAFNFLLSEHDQAVGSVRRFRLPELEQLAKNAGFEVSYASYLFLLSFPLLCVHKLLHPARADASKARSSIRMPAHWLNHLLYCLTRLEALMYPRFRAPFGTSVCLLCRKIEERR